MTVEELWGIGGRLQLNGDILFPSRGNPPAVPEGYYRDANSKYVLHPIMPECDERKFELVTTRCCRENKVYTCLRTGEITNYVNCSNCKGRKGAGTLEDVEQSLTEAASNYSKSESSESI